jgi:hypothetical protein
VKFRKKDNKMTGAIPGLFVGDSESPNGKQRPILAKRTRLRLFRLETSAEKAALLRLCSGLKNKREFQRLLLAHLAFIADTVSLPKGNRLQPHWAKPSNMLRDLERRAKSVRDFADRMETRIPGESASGIGFIMPVPPVRELRRYADDLTDCAKRQRAGARRLPRNRPRPGTREIVHVAEFVKKTTGKHYWGSLAVLLRRPLGIEVNKASVRALVKFYKVKAGKSRLFSVLWFARGFPIA